MPFYFYFISVITIIILDFLYFSHFFHIRKNKLHVGLLTIRIRIYEMRDRKNFGIIKRAAGDKSGNSGEKIGISRMWRYFDED